MQGSGKGTQKSFIEKDFDFTGISTGDVLRAIVKNEKGAFADSVRNQMESGSTMIFNLFLDIDFRNQKKKELVSDDIMLEIVSREISKVQTKGWLLDGYPRTLNQATQLDKYLDGVGERLSLVFFLKLSEKTIIERIQGK